MDHLKCFRLVAAGRDPFLLPNDLIEQFVRGRNEGGGRSRPRRGQIRRLAFE